MNNYIKIGIGVLILDDNKILLGHRVHKAIDTGGIYEPDSWCLPGGKQDYDETILECAIRETKEETNLDISDLEVFNAMDDIQPNKHFVTIQVIAKSFTGEIKVMEKDKIDKWKWFEFNQLPNHIYSPSKKFIDTYLKKNGGF